MAERGRTTLKSYFNTGDAPNEDQFSDLIDSGYNKIDEASDRWSHYKVANDSYVPANNWTVYGSGGSQWEFTVTHSLGTTEFIPSFRYPSVDIPSPLNTSWSKTIDFQQLIDPKGLKECFD